MHFTIVKIPTDEAGHPLGHCGDTDGVAGVHAVDYLTAGDRRSVSSPVHPLVERGNQAEKGNLLPVESVLPVQSGENHDPYDRNEHTDIELQVVRGDSCRNGDCAERSDDAAGCDEQNDLQMEGENSR